MSRPRQTKEFRESVAKNAFRVEIKLQRIRCDLTQGELADEADIDRSVFSRLLSDPDKFSIGRLRKIIQILDLDPLIVLSLLGYGSKALQSLALKSDRSDYEK